MKSKVIFYIGNFHYPNGNAAGKRVAGITKIFALLGYHIVIFDTRREDCSGYNLIELDAKNSNETVTCYSMPYPKSLADWFRTSRLQTELIRKIDEYPKAEAAVFYGSPRISTFSLPVISHFKRNQVCVVCDVVDWLTVKTKNPVRDIVKKSDDYYQKAILNKKFDKSICISSYLDRLYSSDISNRVVIPPVLADNISSSKGRVDEVKRLFYAGNPFRNDMKVNDVNAMKDRVDLTIKYLYQLKKEGCDNFIFDVYGLTVTEIKSSLPYISAYIDYLGDNIRFNGAVCNDLLVTKLRDSDFTILFREEKRDSVAGFPSKVAESIINGIPVIVSDVGDVNLYLINKKTALISKPSDSITQIETLKEAILMDEGKLTVMKMECLKDNSFRPENYVDEMKVFLGYK